MIYLALSILCSTLIFVIFKYFHQHNINNLSAIVINYAVATTFGIILSDKAELNHLAEKPWLIHAAFTGVSFISLFYLIALTTQKIGISVASVANKMSVVIPVVAAVLLYNDSMPSIKIAGILLAVVAVYLSSIKEGKVEVDRKYLLLPILLFVGNGFIDTFLKYVEHNILPANETNLFLTVLFIFAGTAGILITVFKKQNPFAVRNIVGGLILGIPNYGSIYYLLKTLELPQFESSVIFPINNMAIVVCSALAGVIMFKEHLSSKNKAGILLAVIAIAIIAFS